MNACYTLPDVQSKKPAIQMNLNKVGVTNVKKVVILHDNNELISLYPTFDLFVDLPPTLKGANLSRNFEALDSIINLCLENKNYKLEKLCNDIAIQLLERHEYATVSEVKMKCEYVINRRSPQSNLYNQKFVDIFFKSTANRINNNSNIEISKLIGAEVIGMTACPCAQSMMSDFAINQLLEIGIDETIIKSILNKVPMPTHNQRGRGIISIETKDINCNIRVKDIIEIIENSMSSNIYEVLKRSDEKYVVEKAHTNPKFVEDCVRSMAEKVIKQFNNLSYDSIISIKQINEESIHRHNAYAEITEKFGTLKNNILLTQ